MLRFYLSIWFSKDISCDLLVSALLGRAGGGEILKWSKVFQTLG